MLELEGGRGLYFAGPWHQWRLERAARAQAAAKSVQRVGADIERLNRFVERFRYKKSKAKQAQAKLTQIGRLEQERKKAAGELENLTHRRRTIGFEFLKPARTGRTVVEVEGLRLSAGGKQLLDEGLARDRARRARRARRAERLGQDDAARDADRPPRARRGRDPLRPRRRAGLLLASTRWSSTSAGRCSTARWR